MPTIEDKQAEVFGRYEDKKDQLSKTDINCIEQLFERFSVEYEQDWQDISTLIDILDEIDEILDYPDHWLVD